MESARPSQLPPQQEIAHRRSRLVAADELGERSESGWGEGERGVAHHLAALRVEHLRLPPNVLEACRAPPSEPCISSLFSIHSRLAALKTKKRRMG